MSRLRADEVLSKDAMGPFLATEGLNVPAGKNITFTDASEPTLLTGTTLTTTTLNVDQVNIGDDDGTKAKSIKLGFDEDLTLYYDGRIGYVTSFIESDQLIIRPKTTPSDTFITFLEGGPVQLYHGSSTRLSTATTGIDISGNLSVSLDISTANLTSNSSGIITPYLTSASTGTAVTGTATSTDGWGGTTSSAGVLGGLAMAFTCGINGRIGLPAVNSTMVFGGSEFQGGTDNTEGAVMPYAGKVYAATVHSENQIQSLRLALSINGDTTNTTNTLVMNGASFAQNFSVIEDWGASPVTFAAGDRVNFRVSYVNVTQLEVVTVTFFVKFD